jgi:hypothetical protein
VLGLESSLLLAETAPGTALDKIAAFLVSALEQRRGSASAGTAGLDADPPIAAKRLRERDLMIRTRLKRLLLKGQRDGSIAQRQIDSASAMILACLQAPAAAASRLEQQMWDAELVELLLAAVAEPHPREPSAGQWAGLPPAAAPVPPTSGPAPLGEAPAGLTLSSSTSNLSSEPGGIGGGEFAP